jgi:hypothetical protein
MSRLDTSLESSGAEFLVLGNLLVEGIHAFKAYNNFPGYDLIATSPEHNSSVRVQVKSRWATDFDGGFPIRNFTTDFVVFVALNRGYRYRKKKQITPEDFGYRAPQFFVFPVDIISSAQSPNSQWGKVFLRHIVNLEQYENNWNLIKTALEKNL